MFARCAQNIDVIGRPGLYNVIHFLILSHQGHVTKSYISFLHLFLIYYFEMTEDDCLSTKRPKCPSGYYGCDQAVDTLRARQIS